MSRPESSARLEPEPDLLRPFSFILSKHFIYVISFQSFNYAEAFSNGRLINIYSYTIRLQNDVSCLYKMIHKTIVQSLTLLFAKYHMFKRNDMQMTGYILIRRNFPYDYELLDFAFVHVYSKLVHR